MTTDAKTRLNQLLEEASLPTLDTDTASRFGTYLSLLVRWNQRINLTAIREEEQILSRHFVESIACARALPVGIATLLDFGSGAGFPGIPIALMRTEIAVTLTESQGRKAAFLHEAVRGLGIAAKVHTGRAETVTTSFDCVALRAVDRMSDAVKSAGDLVTTGGWLALMTTETELIGLKEAAGQRFAWAAPVQLPGGAARICAIGKRVNSPV